MNFLPCLDTLIITVTCVRWMRYIFRRGTIKETLWTRVRQMVYSDFQNFIDTEIIFGAKTYLIYFINKKYMTKTKDF